MSVRPIEAEDALAVAALLGELGYAASAQGIRDRVDRTGGEACSQFTLVAQVAGEVCGCVSGYVAPYFPTGTLVCRVTALVVTSLHRTRGIGKALMAAAAAHAQSAGCAELEITTSEHRVATHRFYESLGFQHTSRRYLREL